MMLSAVVKVNTASRRPASRWSRSTTEREDLCSVYGCSALCWVCSWHYSDSFTLVPWSSSLVANLLWSSFCTILRLLRLPPPIRASQGGIHTTEWSHHYCCKVGVQWVDCDWTPAPQYSIPILWTQDPRGVHTRLNPQPWDVLHRNKSQRNPTQRVPVWIYLHRGRLTTPTADLWSHVLDSIDSKAPPPIFDLLSTVTEEVSSEWTHEMLLCGLAFSLFLVHFESSSGSFRVLSTLYPDGI